MRNWAGKLLAVAQRDASVLLITTVATALVRLASSVVLTRLLAPDVFGIVGIITTIIMFLTLMTDFGFQPFVVRHHRGDDPNFLNVIWTIHAARGVVLAAIAGGSAGAVAWILDKPALQLPLMAASMTLLVNGLASMSLIALIRAGRVSAISFFDLGMVVLQTIMAIILAAMLHSVWAIIAAMILQSIVRALLSYILFGRSIRKPSWDWSIWDEFRPFSWIIMKSSALFLLVTQLDKVALARLLSLHDFGLYTVAASLSTVPGLFAYAYGSRILYPRYSRALREDAAVAPEAYYADRRLISRLYSFATGALVTSAPALVSLLYDPRYAEAARYLSILAVSGMLLLSNIAASEYLTASGRVVSGLRANQLRVAWICSAGAAGYFLIGTLGVVLAIGFMEVVPLIYFWLVLRRQGVLNWSQEALQLGLSLLGLAAGSAASIGYFAATTLLLQR
ncbi:MAG TPA: oligosaccharide flippase family protein [Allosphingosinicella sp.]